MYSATTQKFKMPWTFPFAICKKISCVRIVHRGTAKQEKQVPQHAELQVYNLQDGISHFSVLLSY